MATEREREQWRNQYARRYARPEARAKILERHRRATRGVGCQDMLDERASLPDRFWAKVDVRGPDECWEWQAGRGRDGYGRFQVGTHAAKKHKRSHRVSYELCVGPIPDGLWVLHSCDNKPCCNPAHHFLGTHDDNMADMVRKRRVRAEANT